MKARVYQDWAEYPVWCWESSDSEDALDIDDDIIQGVIRAEDELDKARGRLERAIKEAKCEKERIAWIRSFLSKENHSRTEKDSFLINNGWSQVGTSVYTKDGKELKMHEAFEEERYKNDKLL